MPKVSVLIPTYNRVEYLSEAINSVIDQTFQDFEIIVIDDGSTDNTKEIVRTYLDRYPDKVRYIYQANKGGSYARNNGMRMARGEYIAFLDSDDLFLPGKLEKTLSFLDKNSNYALVYTDMLLVDDKGGFIRNWLKFKKHFGDGNVYMSLLKECFFIPSSAVIRKVILEQLGGFDEGIYTTSDIDLWLRVARDHEIGLINEPLTKWRIHDNNMSNDSNKMNEDMVRVYKKNLSFFPENPIVMKLLKCRLHEKYFQLGMFELKSGQSKKARDYFSKGLCCKFSAKTGSLIFISMLPVSLVKAIVKIKNL